MDVGLVVASNKMAAGRRAQSWCRDVSTVKRVAVLACKDQNCCTRVVKHSGTALQDMCCCWSILVERDHVHGARRAAHRMPGGWPKWLALNFRRAIGKGRAGQTVSSGRAIACKGIRHTPPNWSRVGIDGPLQLAATMACACAACSADAPAPMMPEKRWRCR